jgi:Putative DNA-binding domain
MPRTMSKRKISARQANGGKARQTHGELRELQRLTGAVIMRPLSRQWRMQRKWVDDRDMRIVTGEFIKPNDRLSSFERIEIYNRQYWFRLIDSFYGDFPGLRGVLGRLKFNKLATLYLTEFPSRRYTMRDLGQDLIPFIQKHRKLVAPRYELALEMARFEWAQVEAFDGRSFPALTVDDLLGKDPAKLRMAIQPHIAVLKLKYPVDQYVIRLKKNGLRGDASNAIEEDAQKEAQPKRRILIPRPKQTFVVVHRYENSLYYKRIEEPAYRLLDALGKGATLVKALESAFDSDPDPKLVREWFETWTELGWFCKAR